MYPLGANVRLYYFKHRTHLWLEKDAPESKAVQCSDLGPVIEPDEDNLDKLKDLLIGKQRCDNCCSSGVHIVDCAGARRSGIDRAANSEWQGLAISRAHVTARDWRALSVASPVLAYMWQ